MSAVPGPRTPLQRQEAELTIADVAVVIVAEGALLVPSEKALIVSDLHFEKGSAQAVRGFPVPPYDTAATLRALTRVVERTRPRLIVSLGDAFHDVDGPCRLTDGDRATLLGVIAGRDMIWISGNHDPMMTGDLPGARAETISLAGLTLRHEPSRGQARGEIAGHLHPAAVLRNAPRAVRRRCLASDGERAVMPAFGAYAGGLDLAHPALRPLFNRETLVAYMLSDGQVFPVSGKRCL